MGDEVRLKGEEFVSTITAKIDDLTECKSTYPKSTLLLNYRGATRFLPIQTKNVNGLTKKTDEYLNKELEKHLQMRR